MATQNTDSSNAVSQANTMDQITRQQVLVLYLQSSALDTGVIGWAFYDGSGQHHSSPGDSTQPPYRSGVHALRDGWRLIQASTLNPAPRGQEFQTDYLKYEFFFERLVPASTNTPGLPTAEAP